MPEPMPQPADGPGACPGRRAWPAAWLALAPAGWLLGVALLMQQPALLPAWRGIDPHAAAVALALLLGAAAALAQLGSTGEGGQRRGLLPGAGAAAPGRLRTCERIDHTRSARPDDPARRCKCSPYRWIWLRFAPGSGPPCRTARARPIHSQVLSTPRAGLRPARPPRGSRKLGAARRFLERTLPGILARALAWTLAWALLAWGSTGFRAADRLADRLDPALEGVDLMLTGTVDGLPVRGLQGLRFTFAVEAGWRADGPADRPLRLPRRVVLGWWAEREAVWSEPAFAALQAGQRWQLPVRLKRVHGLANPHGFDAELWWFEQGVGAQGSVSAAAPIQARPLPPDAAPGLQGGMQGGVQAAALALLRVRSAIRQAIESRVDDPRIAGVLAALTVGDQVAIERDDWALFRTTGIAHLVSISGLHITMFAWLAAAGIGRLWRHWPWAMLRWPAPAAARWGGLCLAAGYAALAGWGVPAQRTVAMLALAALLRSARLGWPWPLVLLLAGAGVTVLDPWALLQPGFWLSFVAVALLMAAPEPVRVPSADARGEGRAHRARDPSASGASHRTACGAPSGMADPAGDAGHGPAADRDPPPAAAWHAATPWAAGPPMPRLRAALAAVAGAIGQGLRTQLRATLGLAPLGLLFFQQVSIVGLVANLAAVPWVTLVVTPLALLGVLFPPLWLLAEAAVQALLLLLSALAGWPWAQWLAPAPPAWALWPAVPGLVLAASPLPWRWRALALPLLWPLMVAVPDRPARGAFELVAVDIGQGTAVLVRTRHHLLVYDSGPAWGPDSDAGDRVLNPLLQARGESRIHRLLLSHADIDHTGGARSLLERQPVEGLVTGLPPGHPLHRIGPPWQPCTAGQGWQWDGVRFELLHPDGFPDDGVRPNARSCVLRIEDAAGRAALLTGDIEAAQEAALLARAAHRLRADVLLVPHHGSRSSSTAGFIAAVAPGVAVVQAAYRSRFGHPAPEVEARFRAAGTQVVRTDRCGAWTWKGAHSWCERDRVRRHWRWTPDPTGSEVASVPPSGERSR